MQDLIAPRNLADIGDLFQRDVRTARAAERQLTDFRDVVATCRIQNRDDVESFVALKGLSDDVALIGDSNQVEHGDCIEAPAFKIGLAQADSELRQAGRRLDLDVGRALKLADHTGDFLRLLIEHIKIVAEYVDNNRRCIARQRLLDALSEKRHDRRIHADQVGERATNIRLRVFGIISRDVRLQIDFEFAIVRTPGVFRGLLCASRALRHRAHCRQFEQRVRDVRPDAQRLLE